MACFLMHCALVGCVFRDAASSAKRKKEQKKAPFGAYPWYLARVKALFEERQSFGSKISVSRNFHKNLPDGMH